MDKLIRLHQSDGLSLAKVLRGKGYRVDLRPPNDNPYLLNIWRGDSFLGSFAWVAHHGWRLQIALPPVHTETEFGIAVSVLDGLKDTRTQAEIAWNNYKKKPSQKAWQEYMGILAAFYTGSASFPTP